MSSETCGESHSRFAEPADLSVLEAHLAACDRVRLRTLLKHCCTRPDWIVVNFERDRFTEAIVLAAPGESYAPVELVRFRGSSKATTGLRSSLQQAMEKARSLGAAELYSTLSTESQDARVMTRIGFKPGRKIVRYVAEWTWGAERSKCTFVSSGEFSRTELVKIIAAASENSADLQIREERELSGPLADAESTLRVMESTKCESAWWRIAVDRDREPTGVVFPVIAFGEPMVGFIGVIPSARRKGFASALLREAASIIKSSGYDRLFAETDSRNLAMRSLLVKNGFKSCWEKQEWILR